MVKVEKMQKQVTGITKVIEELLYEQQVNRLGLWERHDLGDRIENCKIRHVQTVQRHHLGFLKPMIHNLLKDYSGQYPCIFPIYCQTSAVGSYWR